RVVERLEARRLCQHVTDKPGEGLCPAQVADRQFPVSATPPPLPRAPGGREPLAQQVRPLGSLQNVFPELRQERLEGPGCSERTNPRRQTAEHRFIDDLPLLKRQRVEPAIKRNAEALYLLRRRRQTFPC